MIRIPECSKVLDAVAAFLARVLRWSPIGREVVIVIESCEDGRLTGARLPGVVRACADHAGFSQVLVQLEQVLQHRRHVASREIELLVATSALRWHRANRLLITWVVVSWLTPPHLPTRTTTGPSAPDDWSFCDALALLRFCPRNHASLK